MNTKLEGLKSFIQKEEADRKHLEALEKKWNDIVDSEILNRIAAGGSFPFPILNHESKTFRS